LGKISVVGDDDAMKERKIMTLHRKSMGEFLAMYHGRTVLTAAYPVQIQFSEMI
jgi:hypothetical protein